MKPHETTAQCVERKLERKLRLIRGRYRIQKRHLSQFVQQ